MDAFTIELFGQAQQTGACDVPPALYQGDFTGRNR
jgi:hypothetical protein